MKYLLASITTAMVIALAIGTGCTQTRTAAFNSPRWPPATYPDLYRYRFNAPTAEDAYRQGLINRWELEQLEGPTPQALQGPCASCSHGP